MNKLLVALMGFTAAAQSQAASVIDATTKTAITTGFGDMKDTMLDLLSVGWPYLIAGTVILASPGIVKSLLRDSTKK